MAYAPLTWVDTEAEYLKDIHQLDRLPNEPPDKYAIRAMQQISRHMTHYWLASSPFLTWREFFTVNTPFFVDYYAYLKNIVRFAAYGTLLEGYGDDLMFRRRYGFCSHAAILLRNTLHKNGIPLATAIEVISRLDGHVFVMATVGDQSFFLDPDYGVWGKTTLENLMGNEALLNSIYEKYAPSQRIGVKNVFIRDPQTEISVYDPPVPGELESAMKWIIPLFLLAAGGIFLARPHFTASPSSGKK